MKRKMIYLSIAATLAMPQLLQAQSVGIGTTTPAASAALEISSTTQGFLPPRMTNAQINAIAAPVAGMMAYDTDNKCMRYFDGTSWGMLLPGKENLSDAPGIFTGYTTAGTGVLSILDMKINTDQSVLLTGNFSGTVDFKGTIITSAATNVSGFIAKLDANENLLWIKTLNASDYCGGNTIASDAGGNIYIGGNFEGSCDFDPGTAAQNFNTINVSTVFYAKYDAAGNYQWVKTISSTTEISVSSIVVDNGFLYLAGNFQGTATLNGTNYTSAGYTDMYMAKYSAATGLNTGGWVKAMGGTSDDHCSAMIMSNGNLIFCGRFMEECAFGNGISKMSYAIDSDGFLGKVSPAGVTISVEHLQSDQMADVADIAADAAGNIYICGQFRSYIDLGNGLASWLFNSNDAYDENGFVAKYNTSGSVAWSYQFSGTKMDGFDKIAVNTDGSVILSGGTNSRDYDILEIVPPNGWHVFLLKLDATGMPAWVHTAGAAGAYDGVMCMRGNANDKVYVSLYTTPGAFLNFDGKKYTTNGRFFTTYKQ